MATQQQETLQEEYLSPEEQARLAKEISEISVPQKPEDFLSEIVDVTIRRDLELLQFQEKKFEFDQRRAKLYAMSGLFTGKNITPTQAIAQALVKIDLGKSLGLTEAESLAGIYVINGQTSIASAIRASRMQEAGYSWRVDWLGTHDNCTGCRLWLYYNGQPLMKPVRDDKGIVQFDDKGHVVEEQVWEAFTEADAKKMLTTLWINGQKQRVSVLEKDNWKMSRRNMYFSRAITNLQRFHAPSVLKTNLPSAEELLDTVVDQTERNMKAGEDSLSTKDIVAAKLADLNKEHVDRTPQKEGRTYLGQVLETVLPQSAPAGAKSEQPSKTEEETAEKGTASPVLKHLGASNGVAIYNIFPPSETVTHGQRVYIRREEGDTLYAYDSEIQNPDGGVGEWIRVEEAPTKTAAPSASDKPAATAAGPRPLRTSRY